MKLKVVFTAGVALGFSRGGGGEGYSKKFEFCRPFFRSTKLKSQALAKH